MLLNFITQVALPDMAGAPQQLVLTTVGQKQFLS